MVVWHPLLLFAISIIFHMLGFPDKHHIHHHGHEQMHYAVVSAAPTDRMLGCPVCLLMLQGLVKV
jgi:hypothetical protein